MNFVFCLKLLTLEERIVCAVVNNCHICLVVILYLKRVPYRGVKELKASTMRVVARTVNQCVSEKFLSRELSMVIFGTRRWN